MTAAPLRVGVIGADAAASWAGASHVPAIAALPDLTLAAVATRREESARAAGEQFGATRWYADPYRLIADPEIDIVTVAVKVPAHRELVLAALAAGKAVYSEAPLGANLAETEEMAARAEGLHTAIGLQGRSSPAVRRAAQVLAGGALGRVLSARVRATTFGYGPETLSGYDYFNKAAPGATFLTITTAHVLDVVEAVLGEIDPIHVHTQLVWPRVRLVDTGEWSTREVADHVDLIATTSTDAPVAVQVLAGVEEARAGFELEIRGSEGWLTVAGDHPAGVQVGELTLAGSIGFDAPDAPEVDSARSSREGIWFGAPVNVGEVYASLARDIRRGSFDTPGFAHALHSSRLMARVDELGRAEQQASPAV